MAKFERQVRKFAERFEGRLRAIARTAVSDTISIAQKPQIRSKTIDRKVVRGKGGGGRMPVVTGFLRASIQAGLGHMPSGPTTNEGGYGGKKKYPRGTQVAGEPVIVTLLRWDPLKQQKLYVGWTAVYARAMEAKYGYVQGAVEKWDVTVAKAVAKTDRAFEK